MRFTAEETFLHCNSVMATFLIYLLSTALECVADAEAPAGKPHSLVETQAGFTE